MKHTLETISAGSSYACRFRVNTLVNAQGVPPEVNDSPLTPGEYTSIGVIARRDLENRRVSVIDTATGRQFTVDFDDCWDVDVAEWEPAQDD